LTLLFLASAMEREKLLGMLESSLEGDPPPLLPDEEDLELEEELDDEELDEDEDKDEDGEDVLDEYELAREMALHPEVAEPLKMTGKGEDMLFVCGAIERWLSHRPQGPLELGLAGAQMLMPMVLSWSATLTHALAQGPLSLEELQRALGAVLEPEAVETQLEAMVNSGQAEALYGTGRRPGYALSDWGREAITPIVAAVRFEQRYPEDDVLDPDVFDVEAAFQMALPLIRVPDGLTGACRAGVRLPGAEAEDLIAGATVEVADGRVASSSPLLDREPETWVTGTAHDWCETVVDPGEAMLELGGDVELAAGLVEALHERLFGAEPAGPPRLRLP